MRVNFYTLKKGKNLRNQTNTFVENIYRKFYKVFITGFICLMLFLNVFAQNSTYTANGKDQNMRGTGRVNTSTLAMEFSLQLGNYPGRGINMPISLRYSSKLWDMKYGETTPGQHGQCFSKVYMEYSTKSASGWTTSLAVPYIEYTGEKYPYDQYGAVLDSDIGCSPTQPNPPPVSITKIKRVTLFLPSGESHELRVADDALVGSSWDGTYYAVDSSNIKYIQNSSTGVYKVLMPDGSFYELNTTSGTADRPANKFYDRNGNYTSYHAPDQNHPNGYWTNTLGKNIPVPFRPFTPSSPTVQEYKLPSTSGDLTYKFHWEQLDDAFTSSTYVLKYVGNAQQQSNASWLLRNSNTCLFSSTNPYVLGYNDLFNPIVLTAIELPTGEKYKFTYNSWGEIETIKYPTGGEEVLTYGAVGSLSIIEAPYDQANRGVVNRKVYETAGTGTPSEWSYQTGTENPNGFVVRITNPDNTRVERFLHRGKIGGDVTFGFDNVLAGMSYKELTFSKPVGGVRKLLAQSLNSWTKSTFPISGTTNNIAEWHPRLLYATNIVYNADGDGVSASTKYDYESGLNQRDKPVLVNKATNYAFAAIDGTDQLRGDDTNPDELPNPEPSPIPTPNPNATPSSPVVRIIESTYLINDPTYSSTADYYKNQNLVGLVTVSKIKDGAGNIVSQSETIYDQSGSSPAYRANPTEVRIWDSTKGAVTNSSAYISTFAKFDNYGNKYEVTDALGNSTTTTFDSTYHAFPITVTGVAPDQNGGNHGSTSAFVTSGTFDTTTGLPLTATDINGQTTTMQYDPATLRPTKVIEPNGLETQYFYGIPNSSTGVYAATQRFAKVKTQIDSTNWKESQAFVDGLGRPIESKLVDSSGDVYSETEYDIMGRIKRSTNLYKTGETKQWTTPNYDDFGRPIAVTMPDSTTVQMTYGISITGVVGLTKTVTDQDNKKRKGITDVMGNMVRVIEDPDGLNLATDYVFDLLGNLRKTTQGTQNRYFMHDSLGRLLYAKQVEQEPNSTFSGSGYTDPITSNNQWSVKYVYDNNGNIISTTNANNVTITGVYDHLNRMTSKTYSDSTPALYFYYDGKYVDINNTLQTASGSVNGKTTGIKSSVSTTNYTSFDSYGNLLASQQITDGQVYNFGYAYNLSGALIETTYPSGRIVKSTSNSDGELSLVQSKKNSNSGYFAYGLGFSYNSSGALEKMRLGNGLWETYSYNNRSQIWKIGLGTTDTVQDVLKLEFNYGSSGQNNGSMREQKITVPTLGGSAGFTATQTYTYDSLNRLKSATENITGVTNPTWKQTFDYDIYGNRSFDTSNNNTTTIPTNCPTSVCNPSFSTNNDNRFSTTQGYNYNANGSLIQDAEGNRFGYDAEDHQTEFFIATNSSNTPNATYYYDGQGKRVKKITATEITVFVYDGGGQLAAEYSNALAQVPQVSYLTTDHLGSPRVITDEKGAVKKRQDFSAFGEVTLTSQRLSRPDYSGQKNIRQSYTGYQEDIESGLEFAQARYYNPRYGRFMSVDPLTSSAAIKNPQSFNRYSYVLNSPYKFADPLGLLPVDSGSACGQWCQNSGPTGGYASNYDSGHRSGREGSIIAEYLRWQEIESSRPRVFWVAETSSGASSGSASPGGTQPVQSSSAQTVVNSISVTAETPNNKCHMCYGIEFESVTVTVIQLTNPDSIQDYGKAGILAPGLRIGVDLVFNFSNQDGNITGIAKEEVKALEGLPIVQTQGYNPLREGNMADTVASNALPIPQQPRSQYEAQILGRTIQTFFNSPTNHTKQLITVTLMTSNGTIVQVTQERTLTNIGQGTMTVAGSIPVNRYSFTMKPPQITILRPGFWFQ